MWRILFLHLFSLIQFVNSSKSDCAARCARIHARTMQRIDFDDEKVTSLFEKQRPLGTMKDVCWRIYDHLDCMKRCASDREHEKYARNARFKCKFVMKDINSDLRCVSRYHSFIEVKCSTFLNEAVRIRQKTGPETTPDKETCRYLHLNSLCLENSVSAYCPKAKKIFRRLNFRDYFLNFILPSDDSIFDDVDLDSCQIYNFVRNANKMSEKDMDEALTTIINNWEDEGFTTTKPRIDVSTEVFDKLDKQELTTIINKWEEKRFTTTRATMHHENEKASNELDKKEFTELLDDLLAPTEPEHVLTHLGNSTQSINNSSNTDHSYNYELIEKPGKDDLPTLTQSLPIFTQMGTTPITQLAKKAGPEIIHSQLGPPITYTEDLEITSTENPKLSSVTEGGFSVSSNSNEATPTSSNSNEATPTYLTSPDIEVVTIPIQTATAKTASEMKTTKVDPKNEKNKNIINSEELTSEVNNVEVTQDDSIEKQPTPAKSEEMDENTILDAKSTPNSINFHQKSQNLHQKSGNSVNFTQSSDISNRDRKVDNASTSLLNLNPPSDPDSGKVDNLNEENQNGDIYDETQDYDQGLSLDEYEKYENEEMSIEEKDSKTKSIEETETDSLRATSPRNIFSDDSMEENPPNFAYSSLRAREFTFSMRDRDIVTPVAIDTSTLFGESIDSWEEIDNEREKIDNQQQEIDSHVPEPSAMDYGEDYLEEDNAATPSVTTSPLQAVTPLLRQSRIIVRPILRRKHDIQKGKENLMDYISDAPSTEISISEAATSSPVNNLQEKPTETAVESVLSSSDTKVEELPPDLFFLGTGEKGRLLFIYSILIAISFSSLLCVLIFCVCGRRQESYDVRK